MSRDDLKREKRKKKNPQMVLNIGCMLEPPGELKKKKKILDPGPHPQRYKDIDVRWTLSFVKAPLVILPCDQGRKPLFWPHSDPEMPSTWEVVKIAL